MKVRRRDRVGAGDEPHGSYSNYFEVGQNSVEFVFDFGQCYSEDGPRVFARIVTGPAYAKAFLAMLQDAVARHEQENGSIGGREP